MPPQKGVDARYLGEQPDDVTAQAFAVELGWFQIACWYFNTTNANYRFWDGAGWNDFSQGLSFFAPILDKDLLGPPALPPVGAAYGVAWGGGVAIGLWAGHEMDRAEWDGMNWVFDTPVAGTTCFVVDENTYYLFDGAVWGNFSVTVFHSLDDSYRDGATINANIGPVQITNPIADASNALELSKVSPLGNALDVTGQTNLDGDLTVTGAISAPGVDTFSGPVAGVVVTILGAGAVTAAIQYHAVITTSGGGIEVLDGRLDLNNTVDIYSVAGDILTLEVTAAGAITLARTGGALTYTVAMILTRI